MPDLFVIIVYLGSVELGDLLLLSLWLPARKKFSYKQIIYFY